MANLQLKPLQPFMTGDYDADGLGLSRFVTPQMLGDEAPPGCATAAQPWLWAYAKSRAVFETRRLSWARECVNDALFNRSRRYSNQVLA